MPKQPKPLRIYAPRQGIAGSPHVGYGDMRNLDIFSAPGVAKLNNIMEKKSAATVDAQIKWIVKNPASPANIYAIDSNGSVYNSADSGATWAELSDRGGAGQGLAVWKDYLFVITATTIDTYGPLSGTPDWLEFQTNVDTDAAWHPCLVSKLDGKLYIGAGRYVATLEEVAGQNFIDGTGATYTWTPQALDLPEDYKVKCLEELGNNLLIGAWKGTNIYDNKIADIFTWDGAASTYGNPIMLNENGINAMLTIGNITYVQAGVDGKIYKTDGVNAYVVAQIPQSIANIANGKYLETYPGAMVNFKGRPFFGVSGADVADGMGVYSIMETNRGTILNYEHSVSALTMGGSVSVIIGALLGVTRDKLLVGWGITGTITMIIADPCVVTLTSHGFDNGTPILFTTTGALPTGITASTYYFIRSTGTDTFNLYDTAAHAIAGGATGRVATSGSQSGVHTGAIYSIDLTNTASYLHTTAYTKAYFDSPLYNVGAKLLPRTFSQLEFQLAKELAANEGVQIKYRVNLTDSFTTIGAYTTTNMGTGQTLHHADADIPSCDMIQIRVELLGTATTTPEFLYLDLF